MSIALSNVDRQYSNFKNILEHFNSKVSLLDENDMSIIENELGKIKREPDYIHDSIDISILNVDILAIVGMIRMLIKKNDKTNDLPFDENIFQIHSSTFEILFNESINRPLFGKNGKKERPKNQRKEKNEYNFMKFKTNILTYSRYFVF